MRIAQIAPCWIPVPPEGYGGIELVVSNLTEGLVERGHDVTLFASGGSRTKAELVSFYSIAPGTIEIVTNPLAELPHVLQAYARAEEFDVIHDHTFPLGPSIGAHLSHPPLVHTLHGPPGDPEPRPIYELIGDRIHLVAISDHQRLGLPGLDYTATVYNGIEVDRYPYRASKQDYLLFIGRMSPQKGAHLAVETARRLGRKLVVATKRVEPAERAYFEAEVAPRLTSDVKVLDHLSFPEKAELYANAACTLMPIQWPEPFGLVMTESLACGTPVVAWRNGSVPEIVDDGVTGFIVEDLDEFVAAVGRAEQIDPRACRAAVEARFSIEAMLDGYEAVYARVADR